MAGTLVKIIDGIIKNKDGTRIDKVELRAVEGLRGDMFSLTSEECKITVPLEAVEEAVKKVRKK